MIADVATRMRMFVYDHLIATGFMPSIDDIAGHLQLSRVEATERLGGLKIGKTILVHPTTGEIWMAGPFSATETQYRVVGRRASWWANCAWDMFGVATIVGEAVGIETHCTECGDPWTLTADPQSPPAQEGIVHFLLPARKWYEDIGFT